MRHTKSLVILASFGLLWFWPSPGNASTIDFDPDEPDMPDETETSDDMPDEYEMLQRSDVQDRLDSLNWNEWGKCYPAFDDVNMVRRLKEAIQDCPSYQVGQRMLGSGRQIKRVNSSEECHFLCYTFSECAAFKWSSLKTRCYLLKEIGSYEADETYTSGMKNTCTENLDSEVSEYFANPLQRKLAAKASYIEAKETYDGSLTSRKSFSKVATSCLQPLIKNGEISEQEIGTAPALLSEELPFLPLDGVEPSFKTVSITANSGPMYIPRTAGVKYGNWVITGLYAPPGKIITVTTPEKAVSKINILIGTHTDQLYDKNEPLERDPEVTMRFDITEESQFIGSPYGGLIILKFTGSDLFGEILNIKFENILEAPHFVLGEHTNEDWNNHMKNLPSPWSVFEIPNQIMFVVPTRGQYGAALKEDVTSYLEEWKTFMEKNDKAAAVEDRPVAEVVVLDVQITKGTAHSGYPIMGKLKAIEGIFRVPFSTLFGHEIGHNMNLDSYDLNHVIVNLFYNFALPEKRIKKWGTWGRESRIFSYVKSGKENLLYTEDYSVWSDVLKMPMDGPDGSGWEHSGNWNDLPAVIALFRDMPSEENPTNFDEKMDLWAKNFCTAKQMNMVPYFDFWGFPLSTSTLASCNQHSDQPTDLINWIGNIENLAAEGNNCPDGWEGYSSKCFKVTESKFTYQGAKDYCEGLEGSTALASITNKNDAILADWTYFQSDVKELWVESVSNYTEIYPYADEFEGQKAVLGKVGKSSCHYKPTIESLDGSTNKCIGPISKSLDKRFNALCEIDN